MGSKKRKTLQLKSRLPKLGNLKVFNAELTTIHRDAFVCKYGKILALLFIEVHTKVITALAQFYDPSLRIFMFKDF